MIYKSGSKSYSSSGPVLKAVDGNYSVVGLHRGGFYNKYNCATKIADMVKSIAGKDYKASKLLYSCCISFK